MPPRFHDEAARTWNERASEPKMERERNRYSVYKEEKGTTGRTVMESKRDNNRAESERGGG